MKKLDRRTMLRGAGGIAVGLPFLDIMLSPRRASAGVGDFPKRFVPFFSPNGSLREHWVPKGTETDFTLSRILTPLAAHRDKLIVLDGLINEAAQHGPGDGHQAGMGTMLTATELQSGDNKGGDTNAAPAGLANGISIDQAIANQIGNKTKIKSIQFGVQSDHGGTVWNYMSYSGPGQAITAENNAQTIYNRVFGDSNVGADPAKEAAITQLRKERKSVLDAVLQQYHGLLPRLGASDAQRLDLHATQIRDLEGRLDATAGASSSCAKPSLSNPQNYGDAGKLQMDLLVMAMACDLTRVAALQWSGSVSGIVFDWLGIDRGHHDISHDGDDNSDSIDKLARINIWYAQQFAYLLDQMKKVPEGSGTLLDNSLVFWTNELARGNYHSHAPMPYVLAGSAGGSLKTGRFLQYATDGNNRPPSNNLFVSFLQAFGIQENTFGNPKYCTGPLSGL